RGGPGDARWEKRMWSLAAELVPAKNASEFNQGLMELGALVCTPRAPRCDACPVAKLCVAHARRREEEDPAPKARTAPQRVAQWAYVRVRPSDGAVLMRRRTVQDVNANQWEIPLRAPASAPPRGAQAVGVVRHGILDTTYEVTAFVPAGPARAAKLPDRWLT